MLWGTLMAAVLNAANNAINQIYDLDIDRVNKPKRPLPAGTLTMRRGLGLHARLPSLLAWVLAWLAAPESSRRECFWIVLFTSVLVLGLLRAALCAPSATASGPTSRSRSRAACC